MGYRSAIMEISEEQTVLLPVVLGIIADNTQRVQDDPYKSPVSAEWKRRGGQEWFC